MEKIIKKIRTDVLGKVLLNESMKLHTTMRVGGKVSCLYIPNNLESLIEVLSFVRKMNIRYIILGKGSNVIFPDQEMKIFVIKIANVFDTIIQKNDEFTIGAGTSLQKIAKKFSKMGYSGLEFAGGIPGTLGGAAYMNAGAHTHDMSSIIKSVKIIDENLEVKTLSNKECNFGYRYSCFQENNELVIIEATIKLEKGDNASIFKLMAGNLAYRKEMQPLELPSCGSSFKNPAQGHAGQLIEECGLKGYKIGGAQVSKKHANFVVNKDNASAKNILDLMNFVKSEVLSKKGIKLISEIEVIKVEDE